MDFLPKWTLASDHPSFLDTESKTGIEMVSRIYGAMQELISEYNDFADKVNASIEAHQNDMSTECDEFEIGLRQEFQDFIDIINLRAKKHNADYQKLADQITEILENGVGGGEADWETLKNKPFYSEKTQIYSDRDKANAYNGVSVSFDLEVGKTYVVTLNGSEYSCVCEQSTYNDSEAKKLACGDYAFYIVNEKLYLTYPEGDANLTVTFTIELEDIKKIDKKYLPEGIGYEGEGVLYKNTFVNVGEFFDCGSFPKLNLGETYTIVWNGVEYSCEVIDGSVIGEDGANLIGNFDAATGEGDTGEPFVGLLMGGEASFIVLDGSTTVTLSVIGNGYISIPQEYIGNAFPYQIFLQCETDEDSELICNESVEKLEAVYLSGRSITANDGGGIFTLISVRNSIGLDLEFYRPIDKTTQIWHSFIRLSARADGTYSATRRILKCDSTYHIKGDS